MKTYTIVSPSLQGILSDDHVYFEGIKRPTDYFIARDSVHLEKEVSPKNIEILERYLQDIYNLFLRKLSNYILDNRDEMEESIKIQALLQEIIKVKELIHVTSKNDIKS